MWRHSGSFVFRFGWRGVGSADVHPSGEPARGVETWFSVVFCRLSMIIKDFQVHPSLLAKYLQEEEWYTALTPDPQL